MRRLLPILALSLAACATQRSAIPEASSVRPSASLEIVDPWAGQGTPPAVRFELEAGLEPAWRESTFARAALSLAARAPLDGPVLIQVLELDGCWGQAWWDDEAGSYLIQLASDIPGPSADWAIDVLVHEWAHCLVLSACKEDPHGPLWGVSHARSYRAAIDPGQ